jgi:hypothetical protein
LFGPFVGLFGEHCADQPDHGGPDRGRSRRRRCAAGSPCSAVVAGCSTRAGSEGRATRVGPGDFTGAKDQWQ